MNRQLRSPLSLMKPDLEGRVRRKQQDRLGSRPARVFEMGQEVLVVNFGGAPKWLPGVVVAILGPSNFSVRLKDGRVVHRHVDQVVPYHARTEMSAESLLGDDPEWAVPGWPSPDSAPASVVENQRPGSAVTASPMQEASAVPDVAASGVPRSPVADPGTAVPATAARPLPERRQPSTPGSRGDRHTWRTMWSPDVRGEVLCIYLCFDI